jgi:lysophospholipase
MNAIYQTENYFYGVNNIRINYGIFTSKHSSRCLIISAGRAESYLKYDELITELNEQGYDVFMLDHRGQGLSERMLTNPHKGYVDNFDDYADDLNTFIETIVKPNAVLKQQPMYLLAHSMGSTIALRYFQLYKHSIKAAVLSSPMITFKRGDLPLWLAEFIIKSALFINKLCSGTPWYFWQQGDYITKPFANNPLTHSKVRYQWFTDLYQKTPQIQLGGVTIKWLDESLKARKAILNHLDKLTLPIQIIQSGNDIIVDNNAQNEFCRQLHHKFTPSCPQGKPVVIEQAKHELFFETDKYRTPTLKTILDWFGRH